MKGVDKKRKNDDGENDVTLTVMVMVCGAYVGSPTFYWTEAPLSATQIEALGGSTPSSRADIEVPIPGYNEEDDSFGEPWQSVMVDWDSKDKEKQNPVIDIMRATRSVRIIHAIQDE